jgi:hypothetical protein
MNLWLIAIILAPLVLGGILFVVGQYNTVATLRHRIATEVLSMDFLLQQQAAKLEVNPQMAPKDGRLGELQRARAASHKAASNPFEQGAFEALSNARNIVTRASREFGSIGTRDSQIHQLDQASLKLEGLVVHYRGMQGKNPASWIARRMLNV